MHQFYCLSNSVLEFAENKDDALQINLTDSKKWHSLFAILRICERTLMKQIYNFKEANVIHVFVAKLLLYKRNLGWGSSTSSQIYQQYKNRMKTYLTIVSTWMLFILGGGVIVFLKSSFFGGLCFKGLYSDRINWENDWIYFFK